MLEETQVDLAPDDLDTAPLVKLCFRTRALGRVLWAVVREQADAHGVDRDAFSDAMDGDAIASGWEALVEAVVFFTRRSKGEAAGRAVEANLTASMKAMELGLEGIAEDMAGEEMGRRIEELLDRSRAEILVRIGEEFGSSASS